jgi:hypothetical protein
MLTMFSSDNVKDFARLAVVSYCSLHLPRDMWVFAAWL